MAAVLEAAVEAVAVSPGLLSPQAARSPVAPNPAMPTRIRRRASVDESTARRSFPCGCGGVGLSLIQFARLSGCYPIIGVDIHEKKLKRAMSLGATHAVKSDLVDFEKRVLESNDNSKIDICVDNTGIPEIIETAYSLTSPEGGRTVLVGVMDKKNKLKIWTYPLHFNQQIIGSSGGQCKPSIDIPKIIKLIDNNLLDLKNLIGKTYNLEEINIAIDELKAGKISGRLIIRM